MMQQGEHGPKDDPIVVVYNAISWPEAIVIRGLLASAGIASPVLGDARPYPMPELMTASPKGVEVFALQSQAERARQVIAEFLQSGERGSFDEDDQMEHRD